MFYIIQNLFQKLLDEGKLKLNSKLNFKHLTFHDPCYLGRGNDIYDAPRKLIDALQIQFTEIPRNKRNSFCCGAGGLQMFKESENGEFEINIVRTQEALQTNADVIATACPFCNTMMTDGVKILKKEKLVLWIYQNLLLNVCKFSKNFLKNQEYGSMVLKILFQVKIKN